MSRGLRLYASSASKTRIQPHSPTYPALRKNQRTEVAARRMLILQEVRSVIDSVIRDRNFEGLVLGCIEADFCNQILVSCSWRDLSDCYSFAPLRSQNFSRFSPNFSQFLQTFPSKLAFLTF